MQMRASHLPGVQNDIADSLSRLSRSGDYSLDQAVYLRGIRKLRVRPEIDLFANRTNRKCSRYVTAEKDADAVGRDAFSLDWRNSFFLIHPPIPIILKCLRKIIQDRTRAVLILPAWEGQSWYDLLHRVTIRFINLGRSVDILQPGSRMIANGTQLPPGTLLMCHVDGLTN
jgi:hypothetical protein